MADHLITLGSSFLDDTYSVHCSCGFEVKGLNNQTDAARVGAEHQAFPDANDEEADRG